MSETSALVILIAAILTNNILLTNFLGMCSFIACSGQIRTEITEIETPMVVTECWGWDEMGLTLGGGAGQDVATTEIEIVEPGHPLAAGLTGTVSVLTDLASDRGTARFGQGMAGEADHVKNTGPSATVQVRTGIVTGTGPLQAQGLSPTVTHRPRNEEVTSAAHPTGRLAVADADAAQQQIGCEQRTRAPVDPMR